MDGGAFAPRLSPTACFQLCYSLVLPWPLRLLCCAVYAMSAAGGSVDTIALAGGALRCCQSAIHGCCLLGECIGVTQY